MLAVAGGKGGCGKTTTTLGLALAADRRGLSVLAVDADVDVPDLHRVAGLDERVASAVGPAESGSHGGSGPGGRRRTGGRQHRPAPREVPGTDRVSVLPVTPGGDPDTLPDRLGDRSQEYDLVLLDCPAGAGPDAALPLRVADRTLLVTTSAVPSLRDAAKTAAMSRAVGTPVAGTVVTRADRPPDRLDGLLETGVVEAVPVAESPLDSPSATRRYARVLRRLPEV